MYNKSTFTLLEACIYTLSIVSIFLILRPVELSSSSVYTWRVVTKDAEWGQRTSSCAVEFQDKLWLFGGDVKSELRQSEYFNFLPGSSNQSINDTWSSRDGEHWTEEMKNNLPEGGSSSCRVFVEDNKLWMLSDTGIVYSSDDGRLWTYISRPFSPGVEVYNAEMVSKKGVFLIINEDITLKSEDAINWIEVSNETSWNGILGGRVSLVSFNDKYTVVGITKDSTSDLGTYDYTGEVWQSDDGIDWKLLQSDRSWWDVRGHITMSDENYLYIFGGLRASPGDGSEKVNELWRSKDGLSWELLEVQNELWYPRDNQATTIYRNNIWVFGGNHHRNLDWVKYKDVWRAELPR